MAQRVQEDIMTPENVEMDAIGAREATEQRVQGVPGDPGTDVSAPTFLWVAGIIVIVLVAAYRIRRERKTRQRLQADSQDVARRHMEAGHKAEKPDVNTDIQPSVGADREDPR